MNCVRGQMTGQMTGQSSVAGAGHENGTNRNVWCLSSLSFICAALKLCRLIAHLKFYKICKFENHVTRNDVKLASLPKTMKDNRKVRTSSEPNKIYIVRKDLRRAIQKCNFY